MRFADKLDRVINEALAAPGVGPGGGTEDVTAVSNKIEMAKQNQRVRVVERAADQAVKALQQIQRVLKAPDYKGDASFDALAVAIDNMIVGLDEGGNMRRSMSSLLTLPPETSK